MTRKRFDWTRFCVVQDGSVHPLAETVEAAAAGTFPPVDGAVDVVHAPAERVSAVVALTGHSIVATDRGPDEVLAQRPDGYGGATSPRFLMWLADGGSIGSLDVLMAAYGRGIGSTLRESRELDEHPRVQHARVLRREVVVVRDERPGFATLGHGLAGLTEMSVEVDEAEQGRGVGRSLIASTLDHLDPGQLVIAHVSPGNARSLRSFLACGFVPLGSTVIVVHRSADTRSS